MSSPEVLAQLERIKRAYFYWCGVLVGFIIGFAVAVAIYG